MLFQTQEKCIENAWNAQKKLWVTVPVGELRLLSSLLYSNIKKLWLKNDCVMVIPPSVAQMKMSRKLTKSSTKTNKVLFTDHHQLQSLIWNLSPNFKGGLEYGMTAIEIVSWLVQQFSATKITAMASCGPLWLLLLSKTEITATSTVLCTFFPFLLPALLMWVLSYVLLPHLSKFLLSQNVPLQAVQTIMLPSLPTNCIIAIGRNHTAENFHCPHSSLYKLCIAATGFLLDPWTLRMGLIMLSRNVSIKLQLLAV